MKNPHWLRLAKYRVDFLRRYVGAFGAAGALRAWHKLRSAHGAAGTIVPITPPGLSHPVFVRRETTDVTVFEKIFVWRDYDVSSGRTPENIIDCGANTGLSAVWFAATFPAAKVIAVEPDAANFDMLIRNTAPYPNIIPVRAAVWGRCCDLAPVDAAAPADSFSFGECPPGTPGCVSATDLDSLCEKHGLHRLDIVKMDIEGGEQAVFAADCTRWLGKTDMLLIEFHGAECRRIAEQALAPFRWRHHIAGENDCFEKCP